MYAHMCVCIHMACGCAPTSLHIPTGPKNCLLFLLQPPLFVVLKRVFYLGVFSFVLFLRTLLRGLRRFSHPRDFYRGGESVGLLRLLSLFTIAPCRPGGGKEGSGACRSRNGTITHLEGLLITCMLLLGLLDRWAVCELGCTKKRDGLGSAAERGADKMDRHLIENRKAAVGVHRWKCIQRLR
jgi:hypothetical protein